MVMQIKIDLNDLPRKFNSVISRLRNPERGWRKFAFVGLYNLYENFISEGSGFPYRKKWQALRPSTVEERRRKLGDQYAAHPILTRTGKLKNSIRYKVKGATLTYYTQVGYAIWHVTGTSKMPERNFMLLDKRTVRLLAEDITNWIFEKLRS